MPYFLNLGVAKNNPSIDCMGYLINFNLLEIKLMQGIKSRMKKLNFCNKYIAIVIGVLLSLVAPPSCANEEEWNIHLEPMYMAAYGNDTRIADIVAISTDLGSGGRFSQTASSAVNLGMNDNFAIRGELEYRKNGWGWGASGWGVNANGAKSGGPFNSDFILGPGPTPPTVNETQVILWNETLFSPPIRQNGLAFQAKNNLDIWNTDLYAIRTLAKNTENQLDLTFGVKIGNMDNKRQESVDNAFFFSSFPGVGILTIGKARHTSQANFNVMAGPSIGIKSLTRFGKHKVEGLLNQSVLIGEIEQKASFQLETAGVGFAPEFSSQTFSRKGTDVVPITEIKFKYMYEVTDHLSLGFGAFASIWWNVPLSPEFSHVSSFNPGTWKLRESTLSFVGGMGSISYRF